VTENCAYTCCELARLQTHGGSTVVSAPTVLYKGEFKHGVLSVSVTYSSPTGSTGQVDLIPVVRFRDGSPALVLDGRRTLNANPQLLGQPASGTVDNVNLRFLSSAEEGSYSVTFVVKPAGTAYGNRYRFVRAEAHAFDIVAEYLRLNGEGPGLFFVATGTAPTVSVSFSYLAATPVKFAIQIRCFVPLSRRIGDLARCDNVPRFFNTYSSPGSEFGAANIATGPTSVTLTAMMFASVSRDPSVPYRLDVSMGTVAADDVTWAETRDRSDRFPLSIA
jgi:hypothetical protein